MTNPLRPELYRLRDLHQSRRDTSGSTLYHRVYLQVFGYAQPDATLERGRSIGPVLQRSTWRNNPRPIHRATRMLLQHYRGYERQHFFDNLEAIFSRPGP